MEKVNRPTKENPVVSKMTIEIVMTDNGENIAVDSKVEGNLIGAHKLSFIDVMAKVTSEVTMGVGNANCEECDKKDDCKSYNEKKNTSS